MHVRWIKGVRTRAADKEETEAAGATHENAEAQTTKATAPGEWSRKEAEEHEGRRKEHGPCPPMVAPGGIR